MMSWIKDPLVAFLIGGVIIFWIASLNSDDEISYAIEVSAADEQRLSDQWEMQMRRPATSEELKGLIDAYLKEEIYYREAQRKGLDYNDTIVRRRMVQKLTFLTEDIATAAPATDSELKAYYEDNKSNYELPERLTFTHQYFSIDRRKNAEEDAKAALTDDTSTGDPFMLQKSYAQRSKRQIADQFGSEFANALTQLTQGPQAQGPIRSAYGWHTVILQQKYPTELQPYATVREKVISDFKQAARTKANAQFYNTLLERYTISYPIDSAVNVSLSPAPTQAQAEE